jgi:hypothetical protein
MINYPLEPPSAKPNPDPILENNGKQTKFPRVTPRVNIKKHLLKKM